MSETAGTKPQRDESTQLTTLKNQPTFSILEEAFSRREKAIEVERNYEKEYLFRATIFISLGLAAWFGAATLPQPTDKLNTVFLFISKILVVSSLGGVGAYFLNQHAATIRERKFYIRLRITADVKKVLCTLYRPDNRETKDEYVKRFSENIVELTKSILIADSPDHNLQATNVLNPLDTTLDRLNKTLEGVTGLLKSVQGTR
jgi:hypothetical protein